MKIRNEILRTPGIDKKSAILSVRANVMKQETVNQLQDLKNFKGTVFDDFAGGSNFRRFFPGSDALILEPHDVSEKMFADIGSKKDSETQILFLNDPYTGSAGTQSFYDNSYPDVGYAMKLIGGDNSLMSDFLQYSAYGMQFNYMINTIINDINKDKQRIDLLFTNNRQGINTSSGEENESSNLGLGGLEENNNNTAVSNVSTLSAESLLGMREQVDTISKSLTTLSPQINSPLAIGITSLGIALSNRSKAEEAITIGAYGIASNLATRGITGLAARSLGVTSFNAIAGIYGIVSAVVNEVVEIALGVDVSFGYGGQFSRSISSKYGVEAFSESKGILGVESFADALSFSLGFSDYNITTYTDEDENSLGITSIDVDNPSQFGSFGAGPSSFSFSTTEELSEEEAEELGSSISGSLGHFSDTIGPDAVAAAKAEIANNMSYSPEFASIIGADIGTIGSATTESDADVSDSELGTASDYGSTTDMGTTSSFGGLGVGHGPAGELGTDIGTDNDSDSDDGGDSYIATAVTKALGKEGIDIFNKYRDEYILKDPLKAKGFGRYRVTAPKVIKVIDSLENSEEIYEWIWNTWLKKIFELIIANENQLAYDGFWEMTYALKNKFLDKKWH